MEILQIVKGAKIDIFETPYQVCCLKQRLPHTDINIIDKEIALMLSHRIIETACHSEGEFILMFIFSLDQRRTAVTDIFSI